MAIAVSRQASISALKEASILLGYRVCDRPERQMQRRSGSIDRLQDHRRSLLRVAGLAAVIAVAVVPKLSRRFGVGVVLGLGGGDRAAEELGPERTRLDDDHSQAERCKLLRQRLG